MPEQNAKRHRILTFYGYRTVRVDNSADTESNMKSIVRGYASLNGKINQMLSLNPGMIIYSVSHTTTSLPPESEASTMLAIMQSATIVYSGSLTQGVKSVRTDGQHIDDNSGYGALMEVDLQG
ncbi:MAG: hypothetical protein JO202_07090 [Ktedonobacteraceae bacterium]|nr:hypothetical protein [Ktedonobacteraceae bacterium]